MTPIGDVLDEIYVEYHVKYEAEVSIAIAMADANPTLPPRTDLNKDLKVIWHDEGWLCYYYPWTHLLEKGNLGRYFVRNYTSLSRTQSRLTLACLKM